VGLAAATLHDLLGTGKQSIRSVAQFSGQTREFGRFPLKILRLMKSLGVVGQGAAFFLRRRPSPDYLAD